MNYFVISFCPAWYLASVVSHMSVDLSELGAWCFQPVFGHRWYSPVRIRDMWLAHVGQETCDHYKFIGRHNPLLGDDKRDENKFSYSLAWLKGAFVKGCFQHTPGTKPTHGGKYSWRTNMCANTCGTCISIRARIQENMFEELYSKSSDKFLGEFIYRRVTRITIVDNKDTCMTDIFSN